MAIVGLLTCLTAIAQVVVCSRDACRYCSCMQHPSAYVQLENWLLVLCGVVEALSAHQPVARHLPTTRPLKLGISDQTPYVCVCFASGAGEAHAGLVQSVQSMVWCFICSCLYPVAAGGAAVLDCCVTQAVHLLLPPGSAQPPVTCTLLCVLLLARLPVMPVDSGCGRARYVWHLLCNKVHVVTNMLGNHLVECPNISCKPVLHSTQLRQTGHTRLLSASLPLLLASQLGQLWEAARLRA